MTIPSDDEALVREYAAAWAAGLAEVLGQVSSSAFGVECLLQAPAEAPAALETDLHFCITAGGGLRGEMNLRVPSATAVGFAQLLLGEAADITAEFKPEHKDAAEEFFRQVAGLVSTALKPKWGEVQLRVESAAAPSWPPGGEAWLSSVAGTKFAFLLPSQLSAALLAALRPAPQVAAAELAPPPPPASDRSTNDNLDLLKDVELDITLRFGGKRMPLRQILQLSSGSVVELDRELEEPADLLVDGKLIARGEVVVVDGNYGLRVTEIMSGSFPG